MFVKLWKEQPDETWEFVGYFKSSLQARAYMKATGGTYHVEIVVFKTEW